MLRSLRQVRFTSGLVFSRISFYNPPVERFGFGRLPPVAANPRQVVEGHSRVDVVGTNRFFLERQGPPQEFLRLGVTTLGLVYQAQREDALKETVGLGRRLRLANLQRPLRERFRFDGAALMVEYPGQVTEKFGPRAAGDGAGETIRPL